MSQYAPISTPRGHVLFCDDIRQENTGKLIYIGVYTNDLVVNGEFPALLPGLCMVITYIERPSDPQEPILITAEAPWDEDDRPLAEITFPFEHFRSQPIDSDLDDAARAASIMFRSGPLLIPQTGAITVYANVGERRFRLGRLPIIQELPPKTD